eukprot:6189092-Pleurochrysis_carterae.AAC.9
MRRFGGKLRGAVPAELFASARFDDGQVKGLHNEVGDATICVGDEHGFAIAWAKDEEVELPAARDHPDTEQVTAVLLGPQPLQIAVKVCAQAFHVFFLLGFVASLEVARQVLDGARA